MSTALEAASLIMIPSGYEDGTLASVKPTDGTGDFTFSRGSNTSATRVNADGYIEKGYENLLYPSNDLDAAFTGSSTWTAGQEGYDGSNDAWLLEKSNPSTSDYYNQYFTGVHTFSVYVKKEQSKGILLFAFGGTTTNALINIETGAATKGGFIHAVAEEYSSTWWRLSFSINANTIRFYIYVTDGTYTQIADSLVLQDAQINQGLVAYPYIETTTAPVAGGILEDMPRLDYSNGSCPALLLEPSRTNLAPQSEYANAVAGSLAIITDNVTTSPEGVQNAARFVPTSAFGRWVSGSFGSGITNGTTYVASMYFNTNSTLNIVTFYIGWNAAAGADRIGITFNPSTREYITTFTLGSATLTDYDIGEADENGWYRVSLIAPAINANASACLVLRDLNSQANGSDFVDFYGWQTEAGSYPTSYIPTYGVSQTRLVDDINKLTGVGVTGNEFTIFLEFDLSDSPLVSNLGTYFQTFDSSNNSQQEFRFFTWYGDHILVPYFRQDFTYPFGTGGDSIRFDGKILFRSDGGGSYTMFFRFNGSSTKEVRTGLTAYTLNRIDFISQPKTNVKQLLIFNEALTDSECIELTTI